MTQKVDVAIVLGSGLLSNGELDQDSKRRVEAAVNLLKEGKVSNALMCGGRMRSKFKFSLSDIMKRHAIALGISGEKIYVEETSRETLGNALNSSKIVQEKAWKNFLLITSDFHMERALFFFKLVFDQSYNVIPFEVKTVLFGQERRQAYIAEETLLQIARARFVGVKRGDKAEIGKRLKLTVPADFLRKLTRKLNGQDL